MIEPAIGETMQCHESINYLCNTVKEAASLAMAYYTEKTSMTATIVRIEYSTFL